MSFRSPEETGRAPKLVPFVETAMAGFGILLLEYRLERSVGEQTRRHAARIDDGRKIGKRSPMDIGSCARPCACWRARGARSRRSCWRGTEQPPGAP
jgi:polyphosphate kinase 2 (PPK2 family)